MTGSGYGPSMKDLGRLVRGLDEGFDTFAFHAPGSPEYRAVQRELKGALTSIWRRTSSVTLELEGENFLCDVGGLPVVAGEAPGLTAVLRRGRVRALTLHPGSEEAEVEEFLRAASRSDTLRPTDPDDLGTLLWNMEFSHVAYVVAPTEIEEEDRPTTAGVGQRTGPRQDPGELSERIREDLVEPERPSGLVDARSFDSTLYFLDEHEIEYLKAEVERESTRSLGRTVVALLLDTFELQDDPALRTEVIEVVEGLLPHLLGDGDLESVGYLVDELASLTQEKRDLPPRQRRALEAVIRRLAEPEALNQLFQLLDERPVPPSSGDLIPLLRHLEAHAFPALLRWQRYLRLEEAKVALEDALAHIADVAPGLLSSAMESSDRVVVDGALRLMGRLRKPECVTALRTLSAFPDSGIRRSLVDTLSGVGGSACCGELVHMMMRDADTEVRVAAARALADRRYRHALPHLRDLLDTPGLSDKDLVEQRALFEAYGSLAGQEGVKVLAPILHGKGRSGRRSSDVRACAAVALGLIGSPPAREALRKAERDSDPVVRNAVTRALRIHV